MRLWITSLLLVPMLAIASTDEDWKLILELDEGPKSQPSSLKEAKQIAKEHLVRQRQALAAFLSRHPDDPRTIDARIRLASITATAGKVEEKQSWVDAAMREFQVIERDESVPNEKRAEAGYRRVCLLMQSLDGMEGLRRNDFVNAVRNFEARYPRDPRTPRLLVEVATICDENPKLKRDLLERASTRATDPMLKARIADDLKRLALLGNPLKLSFPLLDGGSFGTTSMRGRVGVLIFWSAESVPSILWMRDFRRALSRLPSAKISVASIALDKDAQGVSEALRQLGITDWPTGFDGKGWESPVARECGINALPTVMLLDQRGVVRSVNARYSYESLINSLIVSPPR